MICLSRDELRELTGYRQRSAVIRWLRENCIQHYIGGDAWPRVLHSTLGGKATSKTLTKSKPNLDALLELQGGRHGKAT